MLPEATLGLARRPKVTSKDWSNKLLVYKIKHMDLALAHNENKHMALALG